LLDFHNHVIPGVDDGAADNEQAAAALQAFSDQSINTLIATPHINASLTLSPDLLHERLAEIDVAWERLTALASSRFPAMHLHRGAEIMLDTPQPVLDDPRLRLAGGRFALVEYPFMSVPPQSTSVLQLLVRAAVVPVIAHPERYMSLPATSPLPAEWKAAGALLQVNAGSIIGRYGPQARDNAFALLERGMADYICSDFHARSRPATAAARAVLAELGGGEIADILMTVNPRRLLDDEMPLPAPSLIRQHGMLGRIREWLR
jgi:protein-tyrosine phosphatase